MIQPIKPYTLIYDKIYKEKYYRSLPNLIKAVIEGNQDIATRICSVSEFINQTDSRGWTALHHAILINNRTMIELLQDKADWQRKNKSGASSLDFMHFTRKIKPSKNNLGLGIVYKDSRNHLSEEQFYQFTKITYVYEQKVKRSKLLEEWLNPDTVYEGMSFQKELVRSYQIYREERFVNNRTIIMGNNLHTVAFKDFYPKDIIGEYFSLSNMKPPYFASSYIPKYGNEIDLIEDGFPNVALVPLLNCNGRPIRVICLAISPISSGGPLFINRGFSDQRQSGNFPLDHFALIEQFIKSLPQDYYDHLPTDIHKLDFDAYAIFQKLCYILSNPFAFLICIVKKLFDKEQAFKLWQYSFDINCMPKVFYATYKSLPSIGCQLQKLPLEEKEMALKKLSFIGILNFVEEFRKKI